MIRVQVLGRLSLEARDAPVHALAAQPLRGSLFLYLCVEREASRETLVRMFWPDREEDKARRLLSQTLYELKRMFGEDFAGAGEVIRVENVSVDTHAFEAALARAELDRALAFYQGSFLSDFQRFDSAEFNAWVDRKRAHYERLHRRARRERIKKLLDDGDRAGALAVAQRWSELDPLEDEAQLRTIELLHELGRRAEALQTYDVYVTRLKEVDLVPLDEMRALAARVRASTVQTNPVQAAAPPMAERPSDPMFRPESESASRAVDSRQRRPLLRRSVLAGVSLIVLLLSAFIASVTTDDVQTAALPLDSTGADLTRVAVLYFDDHSVGSSLDYLAKTLTEAVITDLNKIEALNVISRNTVKQFHNTSVSLDSIRKVLKVGTIVEGSVQQAGDSVLVTVSLVDASTGRARYTREIRASLSGGLTLADDVVQQVAAFLRERLGRDLREQRVARGSSLEAYRLYQNAVAFREQVLAENPGLRSRDPDKYDFSLRSADSMLAEASKLDGRWLEPMLLRGRIAYDRGVLTNAPGSARSDAYLRTARALADAVLHRDPTNAEAYELRGMAYRREAANAVRTSSGDSLHALAVQNLQTAVSIDRKLPLAWITLSQLSLMYGEFEQASIYARQALQADDFNRDRPVILRSIFHHQMDGADFGAAEKTCEDGRREFPGNYLFLECELILGSTNPASTMTMAEAYRILRQIQSVDPDRHEPWDYQPIFRETLIARMWAKHGRPDSAKAILARAYRATEADSTLAASIPFDAAHVLLMANDTAGALRELERFLEINPRYHRYLRKGVAFQSLAPLIKPSRLRPETTKER